MKLKLFLQSLFLVSMALVILLFAGIVPKPAFMSGGDKDSEVSQHQVAAQPVTVVTAQYKDFVQTVLLTGSLVAREEILVSPELSGLRITNVAAEEGDHVVKGQLLAELVDTQLKTLIAQNDAALARADAAIAQARSQIAQAEASNDEAQDAYSRSKILKRKGHISAALLETKQAAARTAKARLVSARDGLKLSQADKNRVLAQRSELEWKLGNTKITAPGTGIISRKSAKRGALSSSAGEPLFHIIAKGEIEMEADVPESDLSQLQPGQHARITVPGLNAMTGSVRLIHPEINKAARLGKVRIFIGTNPALHIGTFSRAIIETVKSKGIAAPLSSVLFSDDGAIIQIVKNNKIVTKAVTTGLRADGQIEVTTGLKEGDIIVVRAGTFLREGDEVKPVQATAQKRREAMR